MFCTTECWICEDKNCEHYISKQELYFENQQLKETYKTIDEAMSKLIEEKQKYKSVLDEIREQLKLERKIALSLSKTYTVSVIDKLLDKVNKK